MVQAVGLGIIGSLNDALPLIRQAFPIREYKPQDSELWNQAYARFVKLTT
jgi:hypothetical protein